MHYTFSSSKTCHSLFTLNSFSSSSTIQYTLHHPHYSSNSLIPLLFLSKPHLFIPHTHTHILFSHSPTVHHPNTTQLLTKSLSSHHSLTSSVPKAHTHPYRLFSFLLILSSYPFFPSFSFLSSFFCTGQQLQQPNLHLFFSLAHIQHSQHSTSGYIYIYIHINTSI
jgi:hypothetical protein